MSLPAPHVVILGGGIAGLATAYELQQRTVPFTLLEASSRVGGVVFSEEVDGFHVDGGPDALLIQKPDAIKLCTELGLGDRLVTTRLPRLAYIQRGGRLHPLPAGSVMGIPTEWGPFIRTGLFSWPGKLRMGMELFVPKRTDDSDESIGSFMRRRFGSEAVEYLAEPLLAGIHAGDVERLSVRALFPRFVTYEQQSGSLLRHFRTHPMPPSKDGAFKSLPGGLGEMVAALERLLPAAAVRLRTPVTSVGRDAEGYVVETSTGERIRASAVVSATPAFVAARTLQTVAPAIARTCGDVPYASAATVALAFDRAQIADPLNGSGWVVPRVEATGIMAGTWLSSKWPGRAPEGKVLLRAFFGGARDPRALEKTDAELVQTALNAMGPLIGISGAPIFTRVYRWENANAQHEVGHLDRVAAIDRELGHHPGLYVTGSGFRGVGVPDCVADARATARKVCEWLASPVS
ncbi:MAG: protoporphyrinogen oxidase [Vicinamibacterales bacterium]